jgi:hypothetical protein
MMQKEEYFQIYIKSIDTFCDLIENQDYTYRSKDGWLQDDIKQIFNALLLCHFEIPNFKKTSNFFIKIGIEWTIEFFYGEWREKYREFENEKYWRYYLYWETCFRYGLLFSLLAQDKEPLLRIAEWIENDLYYDKDSYSAQEMAFQLIIAYYIRGKSPNDYSEQVDLINKSHKRFPKMCLTVFDAVINQDTSNFEKSISKLVNWHIKNLIQKYPDKPHRGVLNPVEFRYHPENMISLEASWLWNIALISGMKMPELPEEVMDRIVTPQSIGLVK